MTTLPGEGSLLRIFIGESDRHAGMLLYEWIVRTAREHEKAKQIRSEDVIAVRGTLAKRSPETINEDLATGEVELVCHELRLLNASAVPPFIIEDETDASENTRLKYRYLDLRRPQSLSHLMLRYRMIVEVVGMPISCAVWISSIHCATPIRPGETCWRIASTKTSAEVPGRLPTPASFSARR